MFTLFVVQTVLSAFAATSGLLFNGYILSVLIWQKRIQNANNLFLLNLAIVDILFCLTVLFGNTSLSIFIGSNLASAVTSSKTLTSLPVISNSLDNRLQSSQFSPLSSSSSASVPTSVWSMDDFHPNDQVSNAINNNVNQPSYTDSLIASSQLISQRLGSSSLSELPHDLVTASSSISIVPTFSQGEAISSSSSSASPSSSPSSSSSSSSWIIVPTPYSSLYLVTNFQGYLWTAFPIIFVWTVAGLTIDKYIAISSPLHYSRLITTRKATLALLTSWFMGLTLALPPLLPSCTGCSYTYSPYRSSATITCDTLTYPWFGLVYIVIYILFSILLPLLAITICNFHILLIAESHRHRIITAIYEITLRGTGGANNVDTDKGTGKVKGITSHPVTANSLGSTGSPLPSSPVSPEPSLPVAMPVSMPVQLTSTPQLNHTSSSLPPTPPPTQPPSSAISQQQQHKPLTGSSSSASSKSRSAESLSRRRSRDAFLPVTQLVGSLLLFTTPHYIIFCLETLDRLTVNPIILSLVTLCLILMPTINAYIYGVKSRLIRSTFKRLLHRYLYKQDVSLEIERRLSLRSQGSQNSLFRSHYGRRNSCPILVQTATSGTIKTTITPTRVRSDGFWFTFNQPSNNNNNCAKLNGNWSPSFLINYGQHNQPPTSISLQYPNHNQHNNNSIYNNYNPILRRQSLCIMESTSRSINNNNTNQATNDKDNCNTIKCGLSHPIHRIFNQPGLTSTPFNRLFPIDSIVKLSPIEESTAASDNV